MTTQESRYKPGLGDYAELQAVSSNKPRVILDCSDRQSGFVVRHIQVDSV